VYGRLCAVNCAAMKCARCIVPAMNCNRGELCGVNCIAYRVWKRRKTAADKTRYKELRRQVNYLVRKSKRLYLKRFLDPNLPAKKLWRNLDSLGMRETLNDNIIYIPDQLNTFLATPQTVRPSNTDFDSAHDFPTEEFAFLDTFELEVYNAIYQIRAYAIGADGVPIKFLKIILPHILPYVTHVSNTVLMSSSYPASWKLLKIMPVTKTNYPGSLSD
jgi:hypothetical protein